MWLGMIFYLMPCECALAYNILGILSTPFKSHNIVATSLLYGVAEKGHTVYSYTMFPSKLTKSPNYKEIDISSCFPIPAFELDLEKMIDESLYDMLGTLSKISPSLEALNNCTVLLELRNTTQKFDVLITQPFGSDIFAAYSFIFDIPLINVFPNVLYPHLSKRLGSPTNPSYITSMYLGVLDMDFFRRMQNIYHYFLITSYHWYFVKRDTEVIRQLFGSAIPSLEEITGNTSLIFSNSHFSYSPSIPLAPGVIEVGGIQIRNASSLPENIEKFINEATHGVVYFSLGSILKSETLPAKKLDAFLHAFSMIPQRVLWKWGGDTLPGKSDSVMVLKWMPQRDILAHPNVKLFISHGGLLGTSEAVYEGVPILGIPITYDQKNNLKSIEAKGAGEILEYHDISDDLVLEKISRLIGNPTYRENMRIMSARFRDRPMSPIDTAGYWTEYVIRHKGAHHLKTAAASMTSFQCLLLDVIALVIFVLITASAILYYSAKVAFSLAWHSTATQPGHLKWVKKEKKRN